ncbi:MAG: hypothetical protein WAO78_04710 [Roseovarius sp.]
MIDQNAVVTRLAGPAKYLTVGPTSGVIQPLQVPSDFLYSVVIPDLPSVEVGGVWDGDRLRVTQLSMNHEGGLNATHLIKIKLPNLVSAVAAHAIPDAELWTSKESLEKFPPLGKNDQYSRLAQLYWFHHLSWGAPRQVIMEFTGWSRNNANFHLKQISQLIGLPASRETASSRQLRNQKQ